MDSALLEKTLEIFKRNWISEYGRDRALVDSVNRLVSKWNDTKHKLVPDFSRLVKGNTALTRDDGEKASEVNKKIGGGSKINKKLQGIGKELEYEKIKLGIPQYYGGIRYRESQSGATNIHSDSPIDAEGNDVAVNRSDRLTRFFGIFDRIFAYLGITRTYSDYRVLKMIENDYLPGAMTDLFEFREIRRADEGAIEGLKKLRNEQLAGHKLLRDPKQIAGKQPVEIKLIDIRQTGIESIEIKNLKKTIKVIGEITVLLQNEDRKHHYGIEAEYNRDFDGWKMAAFNYQRL